MPTLKRTQCESNIYHVTSRGVGKQVIFEDDDDRRRYGSLMREALEKYDVTVYAWCFMQNHVHLLLQCPVESLSSCMAYISSKYAKYFNIRHGRTGHLFQSRFDSVAVESDAQLLATIRYIHQNPIRIGAIGIEDLAVYQWGSYREYIGRPFVTDIEFPLSVFGGKEYFIAFHEIIETDCSLEYGQASSWRFGTEDAAIARAKKVTGCTDISEIAAADKETRDAMIVLLKDDGFRVKQIARLTGIGHNIVQRAGR